MTRFLDWEYEGCNSLCIFEPRVPKLGELGNSQIPSEIIGHEWGIGSIPQDLGTIARTDQHSQLNENSTFPPEECMSELGKNQTIVQ